MTAIDRAFIRAYVDDGVVEAAEGCAQRLPPEQRIGDAPAGGNASHCMQGPHTASVCRVGERISRRSRGPADGRRGPIPTFARGRPIRMAPTPGPVEPGRRDSVGSPGRRLGPGGWTRDGRLWGSAAAAAGRDARRCC